MATEVRRLTARDAGRQRAAVRLWLPTYRALLASPADLTGSHQRLIASVLGDISPSNRALDTYFEDVDRYLDDLLALLPPERTKHLRPLPDVQGTGDAALLLRTSFAGHSPRIRYEARRKLYLVKLLFDIDHTRGVRDCEDGPGLCLNRLAAGRNLGARTVDGFLFGERGIRFGAFVGVLLAMVLWELAAPRRSQTIRRGLRWPGNLGVVIVDTLLVRLVFPLAGVGVSIAIEARGWGLFNTFGAPRWLAIGISILALDLAIYLQHVLFHAVPVLWRLHRMHHTDLEVDVTTGIRFHPIEILLSMVIKLGVIAAIGAPALAVLVFEVLLNATSMFNHGNVTFAPAIDRVVRWFVVTPDMHRVHHSIVARETNSNFGFNLSWWDRLFGTYRAEPVAGHRGMTLGIDSFRDPGELRLDRMLTQPFRDDGQRGRREKP